MTTIVNDFSAQLAAHLKAERERRGWSLADLAGRSGVSRAMISKIERGETSPTAALLGRLSGAFGETLSGLLGRVERDGERLRRAADQPAWTDPATGYSRRAVSPPGAPIELVEVTLPAGARVAFPASAYAFVSHLIWMRAGTLTFVEGGERRALRAGDCLALGPPQDCAFVNESGRDCRYVVALTRR